MQEQRQTIYTSQVTPQMREQCQRVLRGEVTTADLLRQVLGEAIK